MKRSLLTLVIWNATAWLTCAAAIGQQAMAPESFDLNRIDSYLAAQVLEKGRVGLTVAIVKNGRTVLAKARPSTESERTPRCVSERAEPTTPPWCGPTRPV